MTSRKCNRLPLLLLAVACLPAQGPASILGATPLAAEAASVTVRTATRPGPNPWPAFHAPLGMRYGVSPNEDSPTTTLELRFSGGWAIFDSERLENWARRPRPARYGVEWVNRWDSSLTLGFGQVPAGSALGTLDTARWNSYVQALRSHLGPRLSLVCNDDSNVNQAMLRPLGGRTRVLEYEVAPEKPDEATERVLQVFSETPGGVFVVALEGPSNRVAATRGRLTSVINRTLLQTN